MTDVVVGVLALVIGLLLCFRGHAAMRALLALWGAFTGFGLGAGLVAALTDQGYLDTPLGWLVALALALVCAALAYAFFAAAVVLAFASIGFVLGRALAAALGAADAWVLIAVGVAGGLLLALLAIVTNLPQLVLVVLSALAGSAVAVGGLLVLLDVLDVGAMAEAQIALVDRPAWWVGQLVLAVVGIIVQLRDATRRTLRQSWATRRR